MPDLSRPRALARPSARTITWVLTFLLGLQPVTTDLYLPALPALSAALGGQMSQAQLTLSAMILSFGWGQLLMGPLSDRFGRRPVLLGGLSLYALAAVACAAAPLMEVLIAARMVQGVGLAASVVVGRALVRDLYPPSQGAAVMSRGMTGLGLMALLSPALGAVLAAWLDWRAVLLAPALVALLPLALVWHQLPETVPQRNLQALQPQAWWAASRDILRHPGFLTWTALVAGTYSGLYVFLATSAFVYIQVLGLSRTAYGGVLVATSLSFIVGTHLCRAWMARLGQVATVQRGGLLSLVGGVSMLGVAVAGVPAPWMLLVPQMIFNLGHGIHQSCGQAGTVAPFPHKAGMASAWGGFIVAVMAFLLGGWLGRAMNGTVWPYVGVLCASGLITCAVAWSAVRRHGLVKGSA